MSGPPDPRGSAGRSAIAVDRPVPAVDRPRTAFGESSTAAGPLPTRVACSIKAGGVVCSTLVGTCWGGGGAVALSMCTGLEGGRGCPHSCSHSHSHCHCPYHCHCHSQEGRRSSWDSHSHGGPRWVANRPPFGTISLVNSTTPLRSLFAYVLPPPKENGFLLPTPSAPLKPRTWGRAKHQEQLPPHPPSHSDACHVVCGGGDGVRTTCSTCRNARNVGLSRADNRPRRPWLERGGQCVRGEQGWTVVADCPIYDMSSHPPRPPHRNSQTGSFALPSGFHTIKTQ